MTGVALGLLVSTLLTVSAPRAGSVVLAWDANPEPDIARYLVGYRQAPQGLETVVDVGKVTTWTFTTTELLTVTYIFRVYAENTTGGRSAPSNEVSATIPNSDVTPGPRPQGFPIVALTAPPSPATIRVNFQPEGVPIPAGYLADTGLVYGDRGGQSYGWTVVNTAQARDRNEPISPDQRYDTLNQFQRPDNPDAVWDMALASGTYKVRLVAGDPAFTDSVHKLQLEGVLALDGTPTSAQLWIDQTATVIVLDGKLTLRAAPGAVNAKVCFLEITKQ